MHKSRLLVSGSAYALLLLSGAPAFAQETAPETEDGAQQTQAHQDSEGAEPILVTG